MVEGARLERVYRGNSIEGSNPSLSATTAFFVIFFIMLPKFCLTPARGLDMDCSVFVLQMRLMATSAKALRPASRV